MNAVNTNKASGTHALKPAGASVDSTSCEDGGGLFRDLMASLADQDSMKGEKSSVDASSDASSGHLSNQGGQVRQDPALALQVLMGQQSAVTQPLVVPPQRADTQEQPQNLSVAVDAKLRAGAASVMNVQAHAARLKSSEVAEAGDLELRDLALSDEAGELARSAALAGRGKARAGIEGEVATTRLNTRAENASDTFSQALFKAAGQGWEGGTVSSPLSANVPASTASTPMLSVAEHFGGERWAAAMNAQVLTMMKDGLVQARVQINPINLGPVGIDLSMRDGVVNVSFDSPYVEVRKALEDGGAALSQSMTQGGVQLGRLEVRDSLEFMAQDRQQRHAQQDGQNEQRQQQEWRQSRRSGDFSSYLETRYESDET